MMIYCSAYGVDLYADIFLLQLAFVVNLFSLQTCFPIHGKVAKLNHMNTYIQ